MLSTQSPPTDPPPGWVFSPPSRGFRLRWRRLKKGLCSLCFIVLMRGRGFLVFITYFFRSSFFSSCTLFCWEYLTNRMRVFCEVICFSLAFTSGIFSLSFQLPKGRKGCHSQSVSTYTITWLIHDEALPPEMVQYGGDRHSPRMNILWNIKSNTDANTSQSFLRGRGALGWTLPHPIKPFPFGKYLFFRISFIFHHHWQAGPLIIVWIYFFPSGVWQQLWPTATRRRPHQRHRHYRHWMLSLQARKWLYTFIVYLREWRDGKCEFW